MMLFLILYITDMEMVLHSVNRDQFLPFVFDDPGDTRSPKSDIAPEERNVCLFIDLRLLPEPQGLVGALEL